MWTPAQKRIDAALTEGESTAWSGTPAQGIRLRPIDGALIPFSLFFLAFAVIWETLAVSASRAAPFFPVFGIPFILAGLYLVAGRFFYDAYQRAHTSYAVTDRAAYVITDGTFAKTTVYGPAALAPLELKTASDGTGTIHFGPRTSPFANGGWSMWLPDRSQFTSISEPARVYALLRKLADR